jgi:23S rRNA pseudouridine1911/1915/1917 synthase
MTGNDVPRGERELVVPADLAGARLDVALARLVGGWSRSRLQALVKGGHALVNGVRTVRANEVLAAGDRIVVTLPEEAPPTTQEGEVVTALRVVFEDAHLVVIDKPAGVVAHANSRYQTGSVADLAVRQFGPLPEVQGARRPGIVHRLDRLTSGLMVLGRTPAALEGLKAQFAAREVEKTYLAVVHHAPRFDSEWLEEPLEPSPQNPDRFRVARAGEGRPASTFIEVRERFRGFSYLAAHPRTGRTHQIRVHLLHAGLPLVGDRVYRQPGALRDPLPDDAPAPSRQVLHAARLAFRHPQSGAQLAFTAPLPPDMVALLAWLRENRRP